MSAPGLPARPLPKRTLVIVLAVAAGVIVPAGLLVQLALGPGEVQRKVVTPPVASPSIEDAPPECRYANEPAAETGYDEWQRTLLDTTLRLPEDYEPPDLVPTKPAGIGTRKTRVRAFVIEDLRALVRAAEEAGNPVDLTWGYRSFRTQRWVFRYWTERKGEAALRTAARPGHSEHQLGTAIDFKTKGEGNVDRAWRYEPSGVWMREHAWEYGFIESYPLGKEALTCYDHEPWHYRYFGRETAADIHASGLTVREYLWRISTN